MKKLQFTLDANVMKPIDELLSEWMRKVFKKTFPDSNYDFSDVSVVSSGTADHGDYQCNSAMAMAKTLKQSP